MSWYVLYADENFCLAQDEYFQKQTYRNRFDILTGNGVQTLTIPVESTGGERKLLRDIRISPEYNGKKTLQAIRSAYGNSAMYDFIEQELEELFLKEERFLFDFNTRSHNWVCRWFPKVLDERSTESKVVSQRSTESKVLDERWKIRGIRPVELKSYPQVFADRFPFEQDLSILDAIFNLGKTSMKSLGHVNNS
ncbi:MAG: WbqC family protein [Flavobacteriales bacterium]|nr:WbqC family protein [Flavobacteriales bacterium]